VNTSSHPDYHEGLRALREQLDILTGTLSTWQGRDDTQPQPEATEAGHDAYRTLDDLLADVLRLRSRLVTEIRARHAQQAAWDAKHPKWRDTGTGSGWSPDDAPGAGS
jgi:hypothetical protein